MGADQVNMIPFGEGAKAPSLYLLGVTIYDDRIEAEAYIVMYPMKRAKQLKEIVQLDRATKTWKPKKNGLSIKAPALPVTGINVHEKIEVKRIVKERKHDSPGDSK